ncbi:cyclic GMP-AMP synthase isoform X2 [Paramormyrops kingsleyae]|uniref:cyclic GMP-AMP synthase isoform X2 n=1 Tax=Paramormyrops kingsleyae TaxID=1676925 RepID=UPI000CD653D8|nr:cyclic GMP-AMP synthase-like isoform X2 [Paramormyrops kingsleyae]
MDGMPADGLEDSQAEGSPSDDNATLHHSIKQLAKRLTLRQKDKSWASETVNDLRSKFLEYLKNNAHTYFQDVTVLNSGSYYETVKIGDPDEFDMMLLLRTPRLEFTEIDNLNGVFYKVTLIKPTRERIQDFLLQDGRTISPTKVLEETRHLVCKFIKTYNGGKQNWTLTRKNPNSPAVTLLLKRVGEEDNERGGEEELERVTEPKGLDTREQISLDIVPALKVSENQSWPTATRQGLDVERWLGRKTRRNLTSQEFYFVAKKPKKLRRNLSPDAQESWRISFSHIEKEIIMNHGNNRTCCEKNASKCCRKQCLKLLKCLFERLKKLYPNDLKPLCSYHAKTVFLHTLSVRVKDQQWAQKLLPKCFLLLLGKLEEHVRDASLPHFFVPGHNLFAPPDFPRRSLQFLQQTLEDQRMHGYPLLREAQLVEPLSTTDGMTPKGPRSLARPLSDRPVKKAVMMCFPFLLFFFMFLYNKF